MIELHEEGKSSAFTTLHYRHFHQRFRVIVQFVMEVGSFSFSVFGLMGNSLTFTTLQSSVSCAPTTELAWGPMWGVDYQNPRIRTRFRRPSLGRSPRVIRNSEGQLLYIESSLSIIALIVRTLQTLITGDLREAHGYICLRRSPVCTLNLWSMALQHCI